MLRKFALMIMLALVSVASLSVNLLAQEQHTGVVISQLNVRTQPFDGSIMGQVSRNAVVVIEARNDIGNWLLIQLQEAGMRGWVAARYINFGGEDVLIALPISDEVMAFSGSAPANTTPSATTFTPQTTETNGMIITLLNVRRNPGTDNNPISQINDRQRVVVAGRNTVGDWVLIYTVDGSIRGWVASRYVALDDGVSLSEIPVTDEVIAVSHPPQPIASPPTISSNVPAVSGISASASHEQMLLRLQGIPIFYNFTTPSVYAIYAQGRTKGNRSNVFMMVGDSLSAVQPWLKGFGQGNYDLGPSYAHLQATIDFFSASPRAGTANSFVRQSYSSRSGFVTASILDSTWVDPAVCGGATPLVCEYNQIKPATALILLGAVDFWISNPYSQTTAPADPTTFRHNLTQVIDELVQRGVIPVLTTFSSHPDFHWESSILFNNIILDIAEHYQIPVINLWAATQSLPQHGVHGDFYHNSEPGTWAIFNGQANDHGPYLLTHSENVFGITKRNLLSLQALDVLRNQVLR